MYRPPETHMIAKCMALSFCYYNFTRALSGRRLTLLITNKYGYYEVQTEIQVVNLVVCWNQDGYLSWYNNYTSIGCFFGYSKYPKKYSSDGFADTHSNPVQVLKYPTRVSDGYIPGSSKYFKKYPTDTFVGLQSIPERIFRAIRIFEVSKKVAGDYFFGYFEYPIRYSMRTPADNCSILIHVSVRRIFSRILLELL